MESLIQLNMMAAVDLESAVIPEKLEDQVAVTEIVFQELETKPVERQEELGQVKIEIIGPVDTISAVAPQPSEAKVAVTAPDVHVTDFRARHDTSIRWTSFKDNGGDGCLAGSTTGRRP